MKRLVHISIASLLLIACGSDGPNFGPETEPTAAQQSAVGATEQSLIVLAEADVQGAATANAALSLASSGLFLVVPYETARVAQRAVARPLDPGGLLRGLPALRRAALAECAVVSSDSVVWTDCEDGEFTINGMVSWSPGKVVVELEVVGSFGGYTFEYEMSGNLTVSATSIEGETTVTGTATLNGNRAIQTVHSEFDVQLTDGCISGGTLTVEVTGSGAGVQTGAVQVIWTGCDAFRVRNAR